MLDGALLALLLVSAPVEQERWAVLVELSVMKSPVLGEAEWGQPAGGTPSCMGSGAPGGPSH